MFGKICIGKGMIFFLGGGGGGGAGSLGWRGGVGEFVQNTDVFIWQFSKRGKVSSMTLYVTVH